MPLYPPLIEGKLPAQYGETLSIPFQLNSAVGRDEIEGTCVMIRTISTGIQVGEILLGEITDPEAGSNIYTAIIQLPNDLLKVGQYYKIQMAFCKEIVEDEEKKKLPQDIGYYSTVGVFKYTASPTLEIDIDNAPYVTGNFISDDQAEKVCKYQFDVYSNDDKLIESSGELLHLMDSIDAYSFTKLAFGMSYKCRYTVWTINNLNLDTTSIMSVENPLEDVNTNIVASLNKELNCIELNIPAGSYDTSGTYNLARIEDDVYNIITSVEIFNNKDNLYRDYTCNIDKTYQYCLLKDNTKGCSNAITSSSFEHMSLYDDERQVIIKFNPKVPAFKTVIQESKIDTIGSSKPFFYRNGNSGYKEFTISGLISEHMEPLDDSAQSRHTTPSGQDFNDVYDTSLSDNNIKREREYKLGLLNWLNNGKPKLFKSPTEGCYIVRLMNVSLAPVDTLGRMLHSFNATAYEVAEYNVENLKKYNMF